MRHTPSAPPRSAHRINDQIRLSPIFVIDAEGKQVGEMDTRDALAMAREAGLDLVEVGASQRPPVCRIMDYGKFKYETKKKANASKKKQHQVILKEVRLRPKTAAGDLQVKVERARRFLEAGDKVQVTCLFRGREMAHQHVGLDVMRRFYELLEDIAKVEREPRVEGRRMNMIVAKSKKGSGAPKQARIGRTSARTSPKPDGGSQREAQRSSPAPSSPAPSSPAPSSPAPSTEPPSTPPPASPPPSEGA